MRAQQWTMAHDRSHPYIFTARQQIYWKVMSSVGSVCVHRGRVSPSGITQDALDLSLQGPRTCSNFINLGLTVQGRPPYFAQRLTRPFQTCSLLSTCGCQAKGKYPTGMLSYLKMCFREQFSRTTKRTFCRKQEL